MEQDIVGGICEKLSELRGIYGELMQLAVEKQPVLQANRDHEAVRGFTEREGVLAARAADIERERLAAVRELEALWAMPEYTLTVFRIAEKVGGQEGEELLNEGRALVELLTRLQKQNDMNRQLIEMNLSYTTFMMSALVQDDNPSSIYGATGAEIDEDSRRHLFNSEI